MEHLALLKRWFYRGSREGEIFVADPKSGLPLRRLVRGIARVYRGRNQNRNPKCRRERPARAANGLVCLTMIVF